MNYRLNKIYYVPGAISLILLLPLCYKFLNNEKQSRTQYLLETIWDNEKSLKRDSISNPKLYSELYSNGKAIVLIKNYFKVELKGDDLDIQKMEIGERKIKELNSKLDTINGVHFIFNSKTKYSSVIHILDFLERMNKKRFVQRYWCYNDGVYVFNFKEPNLNESSSYVICGFDDNDVVIPVDVQQKIMQERERKERNKRIQNLTMYLEGNTFYIAAIFLFYFLIVIVGIKTVFKK